MGSPPAIISASAPLTRDSQLLDLLLEVNGSAHLAPHLRYNLRSPTPSASAVPELEADDDLESTRQSDHARAVLEEAKEEVAAGQMSSETYSQLEAALEKSMRRSRSLAELSSVPHTRIDAITASELPSEIDDTSMSGFLTTEHEEEHLASLDAALDGNQAPPDPHPIRSNERERESVLRNPVSVYNWLRRNHPSIFLQDGETAMERGGARAGGPGKGGRRVTKAEPEVYDEEGFLISGGTTEAPSRSKRKREDEPYRPKGGSSRTLKKRKAGGGQAERRQLPNEEGD
jgi:hypothetical protein